MPLWNWLKEYREDGVDVAAFKTVSGPNAGKRFAVRVVNPDKPSEGLTRIASFANSLHEADRPLDDPREQTRRNVALNEILHDAKKAAPYMVCFCIVDEKSIADGHAQKESLGQTFVVITKGGASESDAYRTYEDDKSDAEVASVQSDAKPQTKTSGKGGKGGKKVQ